MRKFGVSLSVLSFIGLAALASCSNLLDTFQSHHQVAVSYQGNGQDSGWAPSPPPPQDTGNRVVVQGNPGGLIKAGYLFDGWNSQSDGKGQNYAPGSTLEIGFADVVLFAKWTAIFAVTYHGNSEDGGVVPADNALYQAGDQVTVKDNTGGLLKAGRTFVGWWTSPTPPVSPVFPYSRDQRVTMPNGPLDLYAVWTVAPTHPVIYDGNGFDGGAEPNSVLYLNGQKAIVAGPGSLTLAGSSFIGWNTAANYTGTEYHPGDTIVMASSLVRLYAHWTTLPTFTLTYDPNGAMSGTVPAAPASYLAGATVTVAGNTGSLHKSGPWTFTGWNLASDGSGTHYSVGQTFGMPTNALLLFAEWSTFHVSYHTNGATGGTAPVDGASYAAGDSATVLSNTGGLSRPGFGITGWNTMPDMSGTTYSFGFSLTLPSADVDLYPVWTAFVHVSYHANGADGGGLVSDGTNYLPGDMATTLGNTQRLYRAGYDFVQWNEDSGGAGTPHAPSTMFSVPSDLDLYAEWVPHSPVVYYVDTAGSDANPGTNPISPRKTIASTLALTGWGDTVVAQPGTYDAANGETFPLILPPGVTLVGDEGSKGTAGGGTTLRGGGTVPDVTPAVYSETVLLGPGSTLAGFTVRNDSGIVNPMGVMFHEAYWPNNATVRNSTLNGSGSTGVYIHGGSGGTLDGNDFNGNSGTGLAFVNGGGVNMKVTGNLINDEFEMDTWGPDFGGGAAGSPGLNSFVGAWNYFGSGGTVMAQNNHWIHGPPTTETTFTSGGADISLLVGTTVDFTGYY